MTLVAGTARDRGAPPGHAAAAVTPGACDALAQRLVPDAMWRVASTLLPPARRRSQGGGRPRADERACLVAVVFVLASGGSWRSIPPSLGVAVATAHRRFAEWTEHDLWRRLDEGVRGAGYPADVVAWVSAVAAAASARSDPPRPPT